MDVRDWARVSGLCRTTWQLQLSSVKITQKSNLGVSGEQMKLKHSKSDTFPW